LCAINAAVRRCGDAGNYFHKIVLVDIINSTTQRYIGVAATSPRLTAPVVGATHFGSCKKLFSINRDECNVAPLPTVTN
jgi:hypothetical protein